MASNAEKTVEDILPQLISERDSIANNESLTHSSRLLEAGIYLLIMIFIKKV